MLKVIRSEGAHVIFALSGRLEADNIAGLASLFKSEGIGREIELDLKDLTLVSREGVCFLQRCEANKVVLTNCPAYVREWIVQEKC